MAVVRPIFFYGQPYRVGDTMQLHLFEPRYRLMVERFLADGTLEFAYMNVAAEFGVIGLVASVTQYRVLKDKRALLECKFSRAVQVVNYWVEPRTGGLWYALFAPCRVAAPSTLAERELASAVFKRLRKALRRSENRRYIVRTQRGFLNVHSTAADPMAIDNIVSTLHDGDVVVEAPDFDYSSAAAYDEVNGVCWLRIVEPVPGFCVSHMGAFEWLAPVEDRFASTPLLHAIKLNTTSQRAVVLATRDRIKHVLDYVGSDSTRVEVVEVQDVPASMPMSVFCNEIEEIVGPSLLPLYLAELPVSETLGMPFPGGNDAIVRSVVFSDTDGKREIATQMSEIYRCEWFMHSYLRGTWEGIVHAKAAHSVVDMSRSHIDWVYLAVGERYLQDGTSAPISGFFVHKDVCLVPFNVALKRLKQASISVMWPVLRELFIGASDPHSYLSVLPSELVHSVGRYVAPYAFVKVFA